MDTKNEIKSYIVREGMTMADLVEKLADQYGWIASVSNLSSKLRCDSLRYRESADCAAAETYVSSRRAWRTTRPSRPW